MQYGCQSMTGKMNSVILKKPTEAFISQSNLNENWKKYNYIDIPDYDKSLDEYEKFSKIIEDNVEFVFYLPEDSQTGLDSIYAHDSIKVTKKGAILFNTGKNLRKYEAEAMEKKLSDIGIPILGKIMGPGKMEGGDVLWLDEKTVALGLGYRTNMEGINQFKELTKDFIDEYIIVPMPHGEGEDECLHLMSVVSLINEKLAVVYSKFMPVFFREILKKRNIDFIEVTDTEYNYLGSNVLALSPKKVVMIEGNDSVKNALIEKGIEVFTYSGNNISYFGTGGPTCLTCPIWRE